MAVPLGRPYFNPSPFLLELTLDPIQHDPSLEAAKRAEKLLAEALEGKAVEPTNGNSADDVPELDADLIRVLAERLSKEGADAARLRALIAQVVALNT